MTSDEYIETRLDDQIAWYSGKSGTNKKWFLGIRWSEIVAAALIPLLTTFSELGFVLVTIGVLGVLVVILAATTSLFQFHENWIEYRTTAESLKKERFMFLTGTEPYDGEDRFQVLVQRCETLISKENTNWAQYMMSPDETS